MNFLQTHPVFGHIGSFEITSHGVFFALGAVVATLFLCSQVQVLGMDMQAVIDSVLIIFIVGLLAARLGYLLAYPDSWDSVGQLFAIWEGGLVSFTGIIGGLVAAYILSRRMDRGQRWLWFAHLVQAGLLAWSIGRLGNYYAGESGGVVSVVWSLTYGHVPIQLFESFGCFLLFVWLRYAHYPSKRIVVNGLLGYLLVRFCVDFWRDEAVVGLHVSQWASVLLFIIVVVYARAKRI
jgi:phosphatidylglycerol:prolipoprotein diacylglycerol transferase